MGDRLPGRSHRAQHAPRFLEGFEATWEERKWELELGLQHFESYDFTGRSLAEIGQYITDARAFHKRAWEIHFELMYPLLGIYLQLYGLCVENGLDPSEVSSSSRAVTRGSWRPTGPCGTWSPRPRRLDIAPAVRHRA